MFKKTLVALAIAGLSIGANAATVVSVDADASDLAVTAGSGASSQILVSAEGAVGAAALDFGGANFGLNVEVDDNGTSKKGYNTLKTVTVTLSAGTLHPSSAPTITVFDQTTNDATNGTVGANSIAIGTAAVSYPSAGNQVTFTFDAADRTEFANLTAGNAGDADDFNFVINGLAISNDLAAGTDITATVDFVSEVGSTLMDSANVKFASVVNQFSVAFDTSDNLTDKVDVSKGRTEFVTGNGTTKTQTVKLDLKSAKVDLNPADSAGATDDNLVVTVNGDFTFVDADADDKVDTGFVATGYQKGGQSLVITDAAPSITGTSAQTLESDFTITTDGKAIIPTQAFTYGVTLSYDNASLTDGKFSATGSAGAWTLNGGSAEVAFLPFGSAYSQSVTVTNTSTVDGSITVDWNYEGTTTTTVLTATAKPKAVTDISLELRTLAAAAGITGNASLSFVINSPSDQVAVKAVYYSILDKDRAVVL